KTYGGNGTIGDEESGCGVPMAKSDLLSFVSMNPPDWRKSAVVVSGPGTVAGPVPSQQFAVAPYPTMSMTCVDVGQPAGPVSRSALSLNATLPALWPMLIWLLTLAGGSGAPPPPLLAIAIR